MTPEQLAADRAIIEAATDGDWRRGRDHRGQYNVYSDGGIDVTPPFAPYSVGMRKEDCDFIAAARIRWPAALDEIERLQSLIDCCPTCRGDKDGQIERLLAENVQLKQDREAFLARWMANE